MPKLDDRTPVIVGMGESIDRPADLAKSLGPIQLMAAAARAAVENAGAAILPLIDSVDVVKHQSFNINDMAGLAVDALGIAPRRAVVTDGSGNGPLREMQNAAIRIAKGESDAALIVGAEAQSSFAKAKKTGLVLPWMPGNETPPLFRPMPYANPVALKYGLVTPAEVYPLYENAVTARLDQTPEEARAESSRIWSLMSEVATGNPMAWLKEFRSPEKIATPTSENRLISWPYLKFMVAMPMVNQGAAILLCSLGRARELGIAEDKFVYIHDGAEAREPDDYIMRDRYDVNAAQTAVLETIKSGRAGQGSGFDHVELYSCFPVVPKMARRILGLPETRPLTVTGGMSVFGAPVHNYMSHAIAAMVKKLREDPGSTGLLYGQGGYVTKHHALALSTALPAQPLRDSYSVQHIADQLRGPVPQLLDEYSGPAKIETFTVIYNRDGTPKFGVILLRTDDDNRALASVSPDDSHIMSLLTDMHRSAVGTVVKSVERVDRINKVVVE